MNKTRTKVHNQNQSVVTLVGLLCLIGVFLPAVSAAQTRTVSGKVIDYETGEPLAYATVAILDQPFGTITNLAGEFDFHIPIKYGQGQIVFSSLGYVNFSIPVQEAVLQGQLLVRLRPGEIMLDEVLVTEDLTAAELLKIALARIEVNYAMAPVLMDGFYRDTKKANDEYVGLIEAAVKIYDKDYRRPRDPTKLRERVALVELRRTMDYDYGLEKYFNQYNMLEDLLLENFVKYRTFNTTREFYNLLQRQQVVGYNNQPINLVYLYAKGYSLKIYIDDHYGIRKIIFGWGDGQDPIYSYHKPGNVENRVMRVDKEIEFQELNGKLYLKYIAARYQNHWYNRKTGVLELTTERDQALLINQLEVDDPEWIGNNKKMKRYGLQFQHKAYNKAFWASYNTIKAMPLDNKIQLDLEKLITLEEQFESFDK